MTTYTIKQNTALNAIQDLFKAYGRGDNFSYEGLEVIMDYLEELSEDGIIDLDVIAICCDFSECTPEEINHEYAMGFEEGLPYFGESILKEIQKETWAILLNNGNILYTNY